MSIAKQVMDIKVSKGIAQSSNEELRRWTEKGWEEPMRERNYDRSREHLNFENIQDQFAGHSSTFKTDV